VRRLECAAASRPCRRAAENGDAIVLQQWADKGLLGIIDGLGHGHFAQQASRAARLYIEQHFDQPLQSLFRGVGRACRATRGVVMALVRFDLARQTVEVGNVGNIEVRLVGGAARFHLVVRRGILGLNAPDPFVVEHPWTAANLLIMHSDGLASRWSWDDFKDLAQQPSAAIARSMLAKLGKLDDDATVVVARNAVP
jgi:serine/threonine protein phosphatase PrpC